MEWNADGSLVGEKFDIQNDVQIKEENTVRVESEEAETKEDPENKSDEDSNFVCLGYITIKIPTRKETTNPPQENPEGSKVVHEPTQVNMNATNSPPENSERSTAVLELTQEKIYGEATCGKDPASFILGVNSKREGTELTQSACTSYVKEEAETEGDYQQSKTETPENMFVDRTISEPCLGQADSPATKELVRKEEDMAENISTICDICGLSFLSRDLMEKHMLEHTKTEEKEESKGKVFCSVCYRVFKCKAKLNLHTRRHHGPNSCEEPYERDDSSSGVSSLAPSSPEKKTSANKIEAVLMQTNKTSNDASSIHTNADVKDGASVLCPFCGKDFSKSRVGILGHFVKHCRDKAAEIIGSGKSECGMCHQQISKKEIARHMVSHARRICRQFPASTHIACLKCDRSFFTEFALGKHMLSVHTSTKTPRNFKCPECGIMLTTAYSLKNHLEKNHQTEEEHSCTVCEKSFNWKTSLDQHMAAAHSNKNRNYCLKCDRGFATKGKLRAHMTHFHNCGRSLSPERSAPLKEGQVFCPICKKGINSMSFHQHIKGFHKKDPCLSCDMICSSKQELGKHMLLKHTVRDLNQLECNSSDPGPVTSKKEKGVGNARKKKIRVACLKCEKMLSSKESMLLHMLLKHGIDAEQAGKLENSAKSQDMSKYKIACPTCKKNITANNLPRHMRNIHNSKGHLCLICNKMCPSKENYIRHKILKHKDNQVDMSKARKKKSPVVSEQTSNLDEGTHTCPVCMKNLSSFGNIQRHLKDVHREKCICGKCGKKFKTKEYLQNHIDQKHKGKRTGITEEKTSKIASKPANEIPTCPFCNKTSSSLLNLHRHISEYHNDEGTCGQCGQKFTSKLSLQRHMDLKHNTRERSSRVRKRDSPQTREEKQSNKRRKEAASPTRSVEKGPTCPICNETSSNILSLQRHLREVHKNKVACGICYMKCSSSDDLQRHFLLKHKTKLNIPSDSREIAQCPICRKELSTAFSVQRHLKDVHNEHEMCGNCGKTFVTEETCRIHMLVEHYIGTVTTDIEKKLNQPCTEKKRDRRVMDKEKMVFPPEKKHTQPDVEKKKDKRVINKEKNVTPQSPKQSEEYSDEDNDSDEWMPILENEAGSSDDSFSNTNSSPVDLVDSDDSDDSDYGSRRRSKKPRKAPKGQQKGGPSHLKHAKPSPATAKNLTLKNKTKPIHKQSIPPPSDASSINGKSKAIPKQTEKKEAVSKTIDEKNLYACKFCGDNFGISDEELFSHLKVHYKEKADEMQENGKYTCIECREKLKKGPQLYEHMEMHARQICKILEARNKPKHKCSNCGKMFPSLKDLTDHFGKTHAKSAGKSSKT